MRKESLRGLTRMICRYQTQVTLYRSVGNGGYDRDSMRFKTAGREPKGILAALFREDGRRYKDSVVHGADGKMLDFDFKGYTLSDIVLSDNPETQSDVIVFEGKEYIVVHKNERKGRGDDCDVVTVFYCKLYAGFKGE